MEKSDLGAARRKSDLEGKRRKKKKKEREGESSFDKAAHEKEFISEATQERKGPRILRTDVTGGLKLRHQGF